MRLLSSALDKHTSKSHVGFNVGKTVRFSALSAHEKITRSAILKFSQKTADIWQRHHWFPREMTSEKRAQKFRMRHFTDLGSRYRKRSYGAFP